MISCVSLVLRNAVRKLSHNQKIAIPLPPIEQLHERFYIDGSDVRVKTRYSSSVKVGVVAGSISSGYRQICFGGKIYYTHPLVWKMVHGEDLSNTVDHIDRNPLNHSPENLRLATPA